MDSARRAFEAMRRASKLPPAPRLERLLEKEDDLLHAYYSSKVAGSKLTWEEFLQAVVEELDGTN